MNSKDIKNKVAFNEVMNNNGYTAKITEEHISVEKQNQKFGWLVLDGNETKIKVLEKAISYDEAKILLKEVATAIELIDYINFSTKKER